MKGIFGRILKDEKRFLIVIFLLAFVMRIGYILLFVGLQSLPQDDGIGYDLLATNLLAGKGLTMPGRGFTAFRTPLYPIFLAVIYFFFGHGFIAVRLIQAGIGAASCIIVYFLGKSLFGERIGQIAALGMVFYPLRLYMTGLLYPDTLTVLFSDLALLLAVRMMKAMDWKIPALFGFFTGLSVLVSPIIVFLLPLMVLGLICFRPREVSWRMSILAIVFFLLTLSPWIIRNYVVFHEFIPLSTQGGANFWEGNNPLSEGGGMYPNEETWGDSDYPTLGWRGWEGLSEIESSRKFFKTGLVWIKDHPIDFLLLIPKKLLRLWSPVAYATQFSRSPNPMIVAFILPPYFLFLMLAFYGVILTRGNYKEILPLYVVIVSMNLLAALTLGATRYSSPMVPSLVIFATVGVFALKPRFVTASRSSDPQAEFFAS